MGEARTYSYKPLATRSIRLLRLTVPISLEAFDLDQTPPYFGLSYAWGVESPSTQIELEGRTLPISPSLSIAIEQLQRTEGVIWVWIDRICINQDDTLERSRQVQMMNLIYSRAIKTLIWIGDDSDGSSAAWQLIDQIYDAFRKENLHAEYISDIPFQLYSDQHHIASGLPNWDHQIWCHFRRLLERPWFTRIWIVQEVALSRQDPIILHGSQKYPWHCLAWAAAWLRRSGYLRLPQMPSTMQNVDTISNIQLSESRWRLDALVITTSVKCHASDQRDKLYSLLGLAAEMQAEADQLDSALRPDYELTVDAVYTKAALFFLRESKSLSVLTRANGILGAVARRQRVPMRQLESLPSWVPNWCDYRDVERNLVKSLSWLNYQGTAEEVGVLGFPKQYNASAGRPIKLLTSPDPAVLRLRGLRADSVVCAIQFDDEKARALDDNRPPPLLRLWEAALSFILPKEEATPARVASLVASWVKATTAEQHLLGGRTAEEMLADGSAYLRQYYVSGDQCHLPGNWLTSKLLTQLPAGDNGSTYAALATNFCSCRKFIMTQEGRMGIAPIETRPGDIIAVMFGGGVPYTLRPKESGFLFVGETYVYGLMTGEAVEALERQELTEEVFELR